MPTSRVKQAVAAARARMCALSWQPAGLCICAEVQAALEVETPLICFQGALVKEVNGSQSTLLAEPLPEEPLSEVIALTEQRGWSSTSTARFHLPGSHAPPESFYERWFASRARRCRVSWRP